MVSTHAFALAARAVSDFNLVGKLPTWHMMVPMEDAEDLSEALGILACRAARFNVSLGKDSSRSRTRGF